MNQDTLPTGQNQLEATLGIEFVDNNQKPQTTVHDILEEVGVDYVTTETRERVPA